MLKHKGFHLEKLNSTKNTKNGRIRSVIALHVTFITIMLHSFHCLWKKTLSCGMLKVFFCWFLHQQFSLPQESQSSEAWVRHSRTKKETVICSGVTDLQSSAPQQQPLNPLINSISTVPGEWDVSCLPEGRDSQKGGDQGPDTPKGPFSLVQSQRGTSSLSSSALCLSQALGRDLSSPRQAQNQIGWVCWVLIVWLILGFVCFLVLFSRFLDHFSWFNTKF